MSQNHDLQAKTLFDKFLENVRNANLPDHPGSSNLTQTRTSKSFPSPDAAFYDETRNWLVSCEFKPETETKRGILTGVGQCISYLQEASLSYLAIPQKVEDFDIADYLENIFLDQISNKLAIGLIVYENARPESFSIRVPIIPATAQALTSRPSDLGRYWAKMQDLPISVCLKILEYFLNNYTENANEVFARFWDNEILLNNQATSSLDPLVNATFEYHYGTSLRLLSKKKSALLRRVQAGELLLTDALLQLQADTNPRYVGDNYAVSYRKNWLTCMYHLDLISPDGKILDDGLRLYSIGRRFPGNIQPAVDEFTRLMLTNGRHLSLILDLDEFCKKQKFENNQEPENESDWLRSFVEAYDQQGKIKWNIGRRQNDNQNEQLRYEKIFWNKFNLLIPNANEPFSFNWKKITSLID